ncbi:hypothetical protein B0H16DRAFT_1857883, partial [Mycena metata]
CCAISREDSRPCLYYVCPASCKSGKKLKLSIFVFDRQFLRRQTKARLPARHRCHSRATTRGGLFCLATPMASHQQETDAALPPFQPPGIPQYIPPLLLASQTSWPIFPRTYQELLKFQMPLPAPDTSTTRTTAPWSGAQPPPIPLCYSYLLVSSCTALRSGADSPSPPILPFLLLVLAFHGTHACAAWSYTMWPGLRTSSRYLARRRRCFLALTVTVTQTTSAALANDAANRKQGFLG